MISQVFLYPHKHQACQKWKNILLCCGRTWVSTRSLINANQLVMRPSICQKKSEKYYTEQYESCLWQRLARCPSSMLRMFQLELVGVAGVGAAIGVEAEPRRKWKTISFFIVSIRPFSPRFLRYLEPCWFGHARL